MRLSNDWAVCVLTIALSVVVYLLFPAVQMMLVRVWWAVTPLPRDPGTRDEVVTRRAIWAYRHSSVELAKEIALSHSRPRHLVHALHRVAPLNDAGVLAPIELTEQDQWRLAYNRERTRANDLLAAGDIAGYQELADRLNEEARARGLQ